MNPMFLQVLWSNPHPMSDPNPNPDPLLILCSLSNPLPNPVCDLCIIPKQSQLILTKIEYQSQTITFLAQLESHALSHFIILLLLFILNIHTKIVHFTHLVIKIL